ncbi:Kynurenine formamidase [Chytriomyces hyalinus]|nr:Kynurenine formamidase [Chytriomyces hyalinus]
MACVQLLDIPIATGDADVPSSQPEHGPAYQTVDLYVPEGAGKETPLLVFIHGGAWRSNKPSGYADLGVTFSQNHSVGVAIVGYRLSTRIKDTATAPIKHPAHTHDVGAAVAWLMASIMFDGHATATGNETKDKAASVLNSWNPERVFVMGHSCGAHTGSLLFMDSEYIHAPLKLLLKDTPHQNIKPTEWVPRIKGYIGAEGIYDIPLLVQTFPTYKDWFIVDAFGEEETGAWPLGSPTRLTPVLHSMPPADHLIVQSVGDELVDVAQAKSWLDTLSDIKKDGGSGLEKWTLDYNVDQLSSKHDDVLKDAAFFELVSKWIHAH